MKSKKEGKRVYLWTPPIEKIGPEGFSKRVYIAYNPFPIARMRVGGPIILDDEEVYPFGADCASLDEVTEQVDRLRKELDIVVKDAVKWFSDH